MAEPRKPGDQAVPQSASEAVAKAPEPSGSARTKVATMWPSDKFVVEGLPVVTREGVPVTAEQLKTLQNAAKRSGVKLREVND